MNPSDFSPLVATIIGVPLAVSIFLLLVGRRVDRVGPDGGPLRSWSGILASAAIGVSFVASVAVFLGVLGNESEHRAATVRLFDWIQVGDFTAGASFLVDQLSAVMILVVTGVGTLIHIYSIAYMRGDSRYARYFAYLNLFAAAMLLLVLADNLLLLYVGWEGVGLCSYLLIGFWFEERTPPNAAKKAFIVNRIGDFSFLLGIFVLAATAGTLTLGGINEAAGAMSAGIATIAALLLFGGATGKSAQIPLYVWLPDAMAGPTPVSALIHAATMVTAGVYMVARLSPVFDASEGTALTVVAYVGAATALLAALIAATEYDIKKILAYSTVSQLGYMFIANGVGAYSIAIFHLVTHAFFKALMFLGAGAVMHALAGETDIRRMGGLRRVMPVTGWTFMAGWLAISGIVPFAGFFSKDAILASAWHEEAYVLWGIGVLTAFLTAFYMSRLYLRVFEGRTVIPGGAHPHDAPRPMALALVVLAALSVVGGFINLPGVLTLEHFLEPTLGHSEVPEGLSAYLLAGAALVVAVAGIALARSLYQSRTANVRRRVLRSRLRPLVHAAEHKFYVDEIYGRAVVLPGKRFAAWCASFFDRRVIDGAITGSARAIGRMAESGRRFQTGYVRNYAVTFLFGVVVVLSVVIIRVAGP